MTIGQQDLPAIATTKDRATMLTILSGELSERLSRHPIPPRIIVPLPAAPSRWRWLAWPGVAALAGAIAATVAIVLSDSRPMPPAEKRAGSTDLPHDVAVARGAAVGPISAAVAAVAMASQPGTSTVEPPAIAAVDMPPPPSAPPAVAQTDRELTYAEVRELQAKLRALRFDPGPLDGIKGPLTSAGVRRFQQWRGVPATGAVGLAVLKQVREASEIDD